MPPSLLQRLRSSMSDSRSGGSQYAVSKTLILSYVVDWVLILFTAGIGRIMKLAEPNRRPFSLTDPSISYPFAERERVTSKELIVASLVVPVIAVFVASLLLIPGPRNASRGHTWRRKLWEWNAGWMGLGVAYAGTYAATEALKVMYGKPRPDLLSRCNPDLRNIASHVVGGLGQDLSGAPSLVSWRICDNRSDKLVRDGFVSFPSGHSSTSFAGLLYLTLWFCAKFSITIPFHPSNILSRQNHQSQSTSRAQHRSTTSDPEPLDTSSKSPISLRDHGAAPPAYLVMFAFIPVMGAMYIASSRWVDHRHHGFDILFGSFLGCAFAWLGFSLYHQPLGSGQGWAWGARHGPRAFFTHIGDSRYAGHDLIRKRQAARPESPNSIEMNENHACLGSPPGSVHPPTSVQPREIVQVS